MNIQDNLNNDYNDLTLEPEKDGVSDEDLTLLHPSPELNDLIIEVMNNVIDKGHDLDDIKADINKEFDRLKPYGIPRQIAKELLDNLKMSEEQRMARDTARMVTRQALGIPIHDDMFR